MVSHEKVLVFLLRISMGWYMFWAGITKVLDPSWSAASFLEHAAFPQFFHLFLHPAILPYVNLLNQWGLTLIGVALILGVSVRVASFCGVLLLMLYYFAHGFPRPDAHTYIVNTHFIFSLILLYLAYVRAGSVWGFGALCTRIIRQLKQ